MLRLLPRVFKSAQTTAMPPIEQEPLTRETLTRDNVLVSRDFYRIDFGLIVMRPPVHLLMADVEFEALKMENDMMCKYFSHELPDANLIDFETEFGAINTTDFDSAATHYTQLEGEELAEHLRESELERQMNSYLVDRTKKSKKKRAKAEEAEDGQPDAEEEREEQEEPGKSKTSKGLSRV